jgi:TM2 domain-containing membrane protein YozV
MKLTIKYCLICAFLFSGFSGKTDPPGQPDYADSLYNATSYDLAALEYEHTFYLSNDNIDKATALLRKSYCLKNMSEFDKAYTTLQRISYASLPDTMQFKIRYENAVVSYLSGNNTQAEAALLDIDYHTNSAEQIKQCLYLKILVKNELLKWDEADSLLHIYIETNQLSPDSANLSQLIKKPHLHNPQVAKKLSFIIPGSGQIYTGHVFRGFTSIVLQGSFLGYALFSIKEGFYISGFALGIGIFEMFYFGGARYAYYLAEKNNAKKINAYNKRIKDFLVKNERKNI